MRVDLILTDRKCYTFEGYVARKFRDFFNRHGIESHTLHLNDGMLHEYLAYLQHTPPAWALSFFKTLPSALPLCDLIRIPHFWWSEESSAPALYYSQTHYGKIGIPDRVFCEKVALDNVVYLPHGVEEFCSEDKKRFEVVFFADLIDLSFIEKTWEELFSEEIRQELKKGVDLADPFQSGRHFCFVEHYLRASRTHAAVAAFKEVRLDIFGEHAGRDWLLRLPATLHLHSPLPFTEHFEVLRTSSITLAEPHDRWYWPAIAAGSLPLPPDERRVKYYLAHPEEREKSLEKLRKELLEWRWERQIERLIAYMEV